MEARLQRRVQRYGWDLAAAEYESLWRSQLSPAQAKLMECASLAPGERVLDVACGTGIVSFGAALAVGRSGRVVGVDISGGMVEVARHRSRELNVPNTTFLRMDAEVLDLPDASFDAVVCSLGLMYVPDPLVAVREMRRVLRPGGRMVVAVWGERTRCGWSELLQIVDAEVQGDVCPLFFNLGYPDRLKWVCADAGFHSVEEHRISTVLEYATAEQACRAAFVGGPVALAWSRFNAEARLRVQSRYLASIAPWWGAPGYRVPGEFVVAVGRAP